MTKYSKIKKSSFAVLALSLILVAVLAFGGTYAYFSANASASGTVTMGTLTLNIEDADTQTEGVQLSVTTDKVVPNQPVITEGTTISYAGTDIDFFIRGSFTVTVTGYDADGQLGTNEPAHTSADFYSATGLENWVKAADNNYYYVGAANKAATDKAVAVTSATAPTSFISELKLSKYIGNGGSTYYMGATVTITMNIEVIQANYLESITANSTVADLAAVWTADVVTIPAA